MVMSRSRSAAVTIACLLGLAVAGAQERVTLGPPAPGQSQRVRMTQTSHMAMTPQGAPPPGFPQGGIETDATSTMVVRYDVGLPDAAGRTRYDVTYESMTRSVRAQGKDVPVPTLPGGDLTGKMFTVWLDADRQIADVTVPEGLPFTPAQAKQMLGPAFTAVPRQGMAIGDVSTLPYTVSIPVPGAASDSGAGITGTTRTTLQAIEGIGTDRVAVFAVAVDGAMGMGTSTAAAPAPGLAMSFKGTGTMTVNLLTGFVVRHQSDQTIEGTMRLPGAPESVGGFALHGTSSVALEQLVP